MSIIKYIAQKGAEKVYLGWPGSFLPAVAYIRTHRNWQQEINCCGNIFSYRYPFSFIY